jgi:16S rRNA (uracil1498-N3)-methyltransferase
MNAPRLHVDQRLAVGASLTVADERAHYLRNVLRLREGAEVRLFNAVDGEFLARITAAERHRIHVELVTRLREPVPEPGPVLVFAPIRRNRLDWLIEKAVELGAARLSPVLTEHTVVRPEGADRLAAIAMEAAEQCGRLTVPVVDRPVPLATWLASRDRAQPLVFADERAQAGSPLAACLGRPTVDLLVGPEGGFTEAERAQVLQVAGVAIISLGPLILRAETAALMALAACRLAQEA